MSWVEEQIKERMQNDRDVFSSAFCDLGSVVMGETAAKAGLVTPKQKIHNAIQEILKFFGQEIFPVPENIADKDEYISFCLRPSGIMKRRVQLTENWWTDAFGPMLGTLKNGDYVALLPSERGYSYFDYQAGKRVKISTKTAENLQPLAYCFYKPLPSREISVLDLVKYMFSTISKGDIFFYLTIMAAMTIMGLVQPKLSLLLYSYIIPDGNISALWALGALMLTLTFATQILSLSQFFITNRLTMRLNNTIEPAAMMRMLNLPANFFKNYAAGELSQKFSLIPAICNIIFSAVTGTLITSLFSLAYFSQIANIAPALLLPSLVVIAATLALNLITTFVTMKIQRRSMDASAELYGMTYSMLSGIQKIKLTGSEKRVFARWAEKFKISENFKYNPPLILKYSGVINTVISISGIAVIYFISIASKIDVGEYMAYTTSYGMVSASILSLSSLTTVFSGLKPQLDIVSPILKAVPEISGNKTVITSLSGSIEIQNLSFRYEGCDKNVLDGINLKIKTGQYVAIVGKTGCGKSTLIRLLLGFEKPTKGAVYYDGKDISSLDLPSLRRKIGTVLQSGKLFAGDIFSNITISAPTLSMEEAFEAARLADIADDIEAMPMGMHTVITEGSGAVSGGQKQRLMIARAVAPKPKILIFDEATSALDNITQKNISEALDHLKCTRIVVAHRLSTIKNCDRIVVIEDGQIVEDGSFDDLSSKNGIFSELVKHQQL